MAINSNLNVHNLVICANIFVRMENKWLVLKRSPYKKWAPGVVHPIGGKVDLNENPYLAAQRELMEEAGVSVTNMKLEAVILELTPQTGMEENWLIFHFTADHKSGVIGKTDEGEFLILTEEELKTSPLFPSMAKIVDKVLNPSDGTVFATFKYSEDKQTIIDESSSVDICAI